ncbi:MAG: helix-turn-helix domain-containing protein [Anaerolineae bacterium]|nr:helix-turn-helix domain-containing protein [Anaerolineae bacterium]
MSNTSEWVSLGEAAEIIGVHPATIRNWAERGELPFRRTPGGHRRFRRSDLQNWLDSNRITQPTEAQMVVQSALGRARLEIGERNKITEQDWYSTLNTEARSIMRQQGLRLMEALIRHLANPASKTELKTAQAIGQVYGDLLQRQGLTLSQALEGYFYFADFLLEAVIQMAETNATRSPGSWGDMLHHMNNFTREILVAMIIIYEQAA